MTSLAVLAEQALERLGDHVQLLFEGQEHRAQQLADRAARLGGALPGLGVRPGDRVLVCMTNRPEVLVTLVALWRCGAVATPVMPALTADELLHVVADSGARVAVVSDDQRDKLPDVDVVGERRLTELESAEPAPLVPRDDADLAALLYTGGTTGRSKGVALSHGTIRATTLGRASVVSTVNAPRLLVPLPLSHVFGLTNLVTRFHLQQPATMLLQRRFDAADWVRLVETERVQSGALVPSMLQLLLRQPLEEHDLSSLRYVTSGGSPLAVAVAQEFERRVPTSVVCDGYGCTEVTSTATMSPPLARRHGSVGVALPGVTVRVTDDDGLSLPPGADGEVRVGGAGVMAGYWHDPVATAETVVDSEVRTGDVGHLDGDGYLHVVDRTKDLIIRGGFNVFPRDVEDALLTHPAVASAAVVGRPDDTYGEEVVAFVSLRSPATVEQLLAHAAEHLAGHKRPRELHVVDAVPLTSVGKTDRKALRARLRD